VILQKFGLAEKEILEELGISLREIKDARNFVGHKAIKTNIKLTFDDKSGQIRS